MACVKLIAVLSFVALVAAQESNPVVWVAHGLLKGSWKVSGNGRNYASFEGVPYARPPVGKNRFREPQQLKPWAGVWDATKPLSVCMQYDVLVNAVSGSENCLFLNVHTPHLSAGASLPVVVFIHGGAFMYGSGSMYGAANLMNRDVVLVTFNYRLGPLGFLSTGDDVAPGNAGLKDQVFALKWIQDNIKIFGGNPNSVTLIGNSAGAASVHYHYLSPLSKGTFHRGMILSGSAFAPWTHSVKPAQKAKALTGIVGCPTTTSAEMVRCLRHRPGEVIVNAQIEMFDWKVRLFTPFTPTVEAPNVKEPFLTRYPYRASQAGVMHKLPLVASVTADEGLYPAAAYQSDPTILSELENNWEQLASNIFEYNDTLPLNLRPTVAAKIKQRYLGGRPVSQETFPQLVQALSDRLFVKDTGKLAQIHAARSGQPVYVYRFAFRGQNSVSSLFAKNNNNYGVSHVDDVFHIFNFGGLFSSPEDKRMTEELVDMIYSYATTGCPNVGSVEWQPLTPGSSELKYLNVLAPGQREMKSSTDFGHKSFWDNLGFIENENYQPYPKE